MEGAPLSASIRIRRRAPLSRTRVRLLYIEIREIVSGCVEASVCQHSPPILYLDGWLPSLVSIHDSFHYKVSRLMP